MQLWFSVVDLSCAPDATAERAADGGDGDLGRKQGDFYGFSCFFWDKKMKVAQTATDEKAIQR